MGHDANKVVMGAGLSSFRHVTNRVGAIEAGKIVRLKSDETISLAAADGAILGVSFGKDLSNAGRTAIVRSGLGIPVLLTAAFSPTIGAIVNISDTTGLAGAAGAGFTATKAKYLSGAKTAIKEDGTEVASIVAIVDAEGGF